MTDLTERLLDDPYELAVEGWGYAGPYFREKWKAERRLRLLRMAQHCAAEALSEQEGSRQSSREPAVETVEAATQAHIDTDTPGTPTTDPKALDNLLANDPEGGG